MHLIFQQYEERLNRRQAKPNTIRNLRRTATLFEESGLDPMTAEDWQIEEWLAGLLMPIANGDPRTKEESKTQAARKSSGLSPRTIRLHAENLSAVFNYAAHRKIIPFSPMESVKLPREPDREPRILENSELRLLLSQAIDEQDWLMLNLLIYTGMRRNEVRNLRWEDISWESIRVIGKGDKLRHVPVHPALAEVLVKAEPKGAYVLCGWKAHSPLAENSLFYRLERVRGEIECSFHDFRRTVATSLAENEVPEGIIDRIMGWAPRTVGSRYYIRRADSKLQEAILKLYSDDPLFDLSSSRRRDSIRLVSSLR